MATRTPNGFLVFLGSLAAVFLVAVIFTWTIASGPRPSDLEKKRAELRIAAREKLDKENVEAFSKEAWVDKEKGIVRVPVTGILASVAKELGAKKPAPSQVKVDALMPVITIDPNATEPPPPAMPSAPNGAHTVIFTSLTAPAPATPATPPAVPAPAATTPSTPPAAPAPAPAATATPPAAPAPAPATPTTPPAAAPPTPPAAPPAPSSPAPEAPARPPLINSTDQK